MVKVLFKMRPTRRRKTLESLNHKVTEYFSVRKSDRRTKRELQEEKRLLLEFALKKGIEDGLQVKHIKDKGRGVFAAKNFHKGEFVVEYSGELIDVNEACKREKMYEEDENAGCYMYYFKYNEQQYCVDATEESGKLGRLINHSRSGNLITRTVLVDGVPRLAFLAKADIREGDELLYDYGDRSKEALEHHPCRRPLNEKHGRCRLLRMAKRLQGNTDYGRTAQKNLKIQRTPALKAEGSL